MQGKGQEFGKGGGRNLHILSLSISEIHTEELTM